MGLFTRVSRLFGSTPESTARTATSPQHDATTREGAASADTTAVAELEADRDNESIGLADPELRDEADDFETFAGASESSPAGSELSAEVKPFSPLPAKKNKQELIEELSRNYQEVLQLVRKVSDHLDREDEREKRVGELATKVDSIGHALETMPERLNENAVRLNKQIVDAIDRQAQAEHKALEQVIEQSRKSGETQGKLVTTMAEFRETMGDMSKSGEKSNEILAEMSRNANETREEIAQLIVTSKRWTTVAMVASLSVAVVAIVIAAISLLTTG